jgi:hypothetical protein
MAIEGMSPSIAMLAERVVLVPLLSGTLKKVLYSQGE